MSGAIDATDDLGVARQLVAQALEERDPDKLKDARARLAEVGAIVDSACLDAVGAAMRGRPMTEQPASPTRSQVLSWALAAGRREWLTIGGSAWVAVGDALDGDVAQLDDGQLQAAVGALVQDDVQDAGIWRTIGSRIVASGTVGILSSQTWDVVRHRFDRLAPEHPIHLFVLAGIGEQEFALGMLRSQGAELVDIGSLVAGIAGWDDALPVLQRGCVGRMEPSGDESIPAVEWAVDELVRAAVRGDRTVLPDLLEAAGDRSDLRSALTACVAEELAAIDEYDQLFRSVVSTLSGPITEEAHHGATA